MENSRPNYKTIYNKSSQKIPYIDCLKLNINLNKHLELPKNLKWIEAKISSKCEFIGAKASGLEYDYIFIWKKDNLSHILYSYTSKHIFSFDFATNNLSFIIVYETEGIIHYNMKSGNKICYLNLNEKIAKPITSSFSAQCRYYAIATESSLYVWDILTGENKVNYKDNAPLKYIRNDILLLISMTGYMKISKIDDSFKTIDSFQLKDIKNHTEILSCVLNEERTELYYSTKIGIFKAIISGSDNNNGDSMKILDFEGYDTLASFISSDCKTFFTTDYNLIYFWEEGKGNIGSIPRQHFNYISISFSNSIIITIDDIGIYLKNFADLNNEKPQSVIWTNENFNEFKEIFFSSDYSILLTKINEYSAAIWNCKTGEMLYQWYNKTSNWYQAVEMAPITSQLTVLATKSSDNLIEIWDYTTGIPLIPLIGFNAYIIKFSKEGYSIAAGSVEGEEIARVWDLNSFDEPISLFNEGEPNKNTSLCITADFSMLICQAEHQSPLIYEISSGTMISKCSCELDFSYIREMKCADDCRTFYSSGYKDKEPIASLWSLEECKILQNFNNCTSIQLSDDSVHFITYKSYGITGGKNQTTLWTIEKDLLLVPMEMGISVEENYFSVDSNVVISLVAVDNEDRYILTEVNNPKIMLGEVVYTQLDKGYARTHLTAMKDNLILRRITIA